jgi:Tol biopolymer transport system component
MEDLGRTNRPFALAVASAGLALVFALAVLLAPAAHGAFRGKPGLIAYDTSSQSGGGESESDCNSEADAIKTMRSSGTDKKRLGLGVDPSFSLSGRQIVYSFCDGIQNDVWIMNSDGSGAHDVTASKKVSEDEPSFSADGKRIFFSRDAGGEGYSSIYSAALDGSALKRLTHSGKEGSDNSPQESASGRFVVFQRGGRIFTMRPNGAHLHRLAIGYDPTVSPNSRTVAYAFEGQIFLIGAGGGGAHALTHFKANGPAEALSPTFSPDGRAVAFALERSVSYGPGFTDSEQLMKIQVAGGKLEQLTNSKTGGFHPDWQPLR